MKNIFKRALVFALAFVLVLGGMSFDGAKAEENVTLTKPKISVKGNADSIDVSIKNVEGAEDYMIFIKESNDAKFNLIADIEKTEGAKTKYTIKDLESGSYKIKVKASKELTFSKYSKTKIANVNGKNNDTEKDIVILFTSDVHCGIDKGFTYAGLKAVKDTLSESNNVLLVDDGDSIQGEPVGTLTNGETIIDLMNAVGYDIAIPGNHEFDYGVDRFIELTQKANFTYLSCNFNKNGKLVLKPYIIKRVGGKNVAFVGITTPQTITTSTPKYFMNSKGKFVYGFMQDKDGTKLYNAVQIAVDDARKNGAEYVVAMAHLGNLAECEPWTYYDLIANTTGIDILLDGHSHDVDSATVKNKDGQDVLRQACGTKLASIGYAKISTDGNLSTGLYNWTNTDSAVEVLGITNDMTEELKKALDVLNAKLAEVVAKTDVELTINDPVKRADNGSAIRIIRRAETNLGDICADAYIDQSGADVAIVNGGGIRVSIAKGDITLNNILNVHPFGNMLTVIEVTGQQLLDALEWGCRATPSEIGGFPQVSGMTYEIHTYIDSTCTSDDNSMFTGVAGEYRVKNVKINGEDLDLKKTYTLASTDYILLNNGDGYTMFKDCKVLQNAVKLDNQVLIDYLTGTLGGVVPEKYSDPYGEGRIVAVDKAE